jgi:NAD+ kinase
MKGRKGRQIPVRRAILFINPQKAQARKLGNEIMRELPSLGIMTETFSLKKKPDLETELAFDVALSLGGDGTVICSARNISPQGVPIFPINLGTYGFIASVEPCEWREVFNMWLDGKLSLSRRLMLEVKVERKGCEIFRECCLNDVIISALGIAKIVRLRVSSIGAGKKDILLGTYRSDGLIASTPTGSTAYSKAAGGPIIDPELEVLILNPICPFTRINRPIVFPIGERVVVEVEEEQRCELILTVDGQVEEKLKIGDKIFLEKAPYSCLLIASDRENFYQKLRTKHAWEETT